MCFGNYSDKFLLFIHILRKARKVNNKSEFILKKYFSLGGNMEYQQKFINGRT
jgi:hypothetical protein